MMMFRVLTTLLLAVFGLMPAYAQIGSADCRPDQQGQAQLQSLRPGLHTVQGPRAGFDPCQASVRFRLPPGSAQAPLMISLHGGGGIKDVLASDQAFFEHGMATLTFDAYDMNRFTGRGSLFWARQVSNEARQRMARIPVGASLIGNPVSGAPGFQIGNVFVMAGIPSVMQAMLEEVRPRLPVSTPLKSVTVSAFIGEGSIAKGLADLQKKNPDVPLGSYPFSRDGKFGTALVARGTDATRLEEIKAAFGAIMREAGQEPLPEAS